MVSTAQKTKFFIKDFFSKCNQIRSFLRIWSNLLKKSLMEIFIFCAVIIFEALQGLFLPRSFLGLSSRYPPPIINQKTWQFA